MNATPTTFACAPRTSLFAAKFPGKCACGAKIATGDQIAWSKTYDHCIVGCFACDFGTFPGWSADALLAHARGCMALANNAINMMARDGSVGRLLTLSTLAAQAHRAIIQH